MLLPRRDRPSAELAVPDLDPDRGRQYIRAVRQRHGIWFSAVHKRSELPDETRAALRQPTDLQDPVAAGIEVAQGIGTVHDRDLLDSIENVVDWWISERGVSFAIEAASNVRHWSAAVISEHALDYRDRDRATIGRADYRPGANATVADLALIRLRRHLALLPEQEWIDAATAAEPSRVLDSMGPIRDRAERQRINHNIHMTFLFPTKQTWVDEDLATLSSTREAESRYTSEEAPKLSSAVHRLGQLDELAPHWSPFGEDRHSGAQLAGDALPTLLDLFGPDLVPWILERLRAESDTGRSIKMLKKVREDHAKALALVDTDAAVLALHELTDNGAARREFLAIQKDQPERVAALLNPDAATTEEPGGELRAHPIGGTPSALSQITPTAKLPSFLSVDQCPPVLLPGREEALSRPAVEQLLSLLTTSKLGEPNQTVRAVAAELDPVSIGDLLHHLFETWRESGLKADHKWILDAVGVLGNDDTVRWLGPVTRELPGQGFAKRAIHAVDALATIGTPRAFAEISAVGNAAKRLKTLRNHAGELVGRIAEERGYSVDELNDFLVPDLGLGQGATTLDYGPRQFTVGFDELLNPFIIDDRGDQRNQIPRVTRTDDKPLATASAERFRAIRSEVRKVAAQQIERLETAMMTRRLWRAEHFRTLLVEHPLLVHLVRRLVWATNVGADVTTFRVAEDGTFEDLADQPVIVQPDGAVWVAHRARMGEQTTARWATIFHDYEIGQPFDQLAREVFLPTAEEAELSRFTRFEGLSCRPAVLLKLEKRGWILSASRDRLELPLPDGRAFSIVADPPYLVNSGPPIQLVKVAVSEGVFGTADAGAFSELVVALLSLRQPAA